MAAGVVDAFDLEFGEAHTVTVEVRRWYEDADCVVIYGDGVNDERAIALTADESRRLAAALTKAADDQAVA